MNHVNKNLKMDVICTVKIKFLNFKIHETKMVDKSS